MNYFLDRLKEPSTWRGVVLICTSAFGINISPGMQDALVYIGLGIVGVLGVITKDKQ